MLVSRKEAEEAILTLLNYITTENSHEVLQNTPARVIDSFLQFFSGYNIDVDLELSKSFENNFGYDDIVLVDNISLVSKCEHHLLPIRGVAHVAYIPHKKMLGLSKMCRVVDAFARRLQLQERLTFQIADAIQRNLNPKGVAVYIVAEHDCMSIRGVMKGQSKTTTTHFTGVFLNNPELQRKFFGLI